MLKLNLRNDIDVTGLAGILIVTETWLGKE
jgi:hypothetical protein